MGSWTYSGDPATGDRDAVRFWTQDTDDDRPLLADEEVDFLLAKTKPLWNDPIATSIFACRVIIAKFTGIASVSADGVSFSVDALVANYRALESDLRRTYQELSAAYAVPLVFGVDMYPTFDLSVRPPWIGSGSMDNPRAGQQDYGYGAAYPYGPAEIPDSGYWTGN